MAEKKKKKDTSIADLVEPINVKRDFKKDYEALSKWLHQDNQSKMMDQTLVPLFDDLYQTMMGNELKGMKGKIAEKLGKDSASLKKDKLQELMSEYIIDFFKKYKPEILDTNEINSYTNSEEKYNRLIKLYDATIGLEGKDTLEVAIKRLLRSDETKVRQVKALLKRITGKDKESPGHHETLMSHLNAKAIQHYAVPHEHKYHQHILGILQKQAGKEYTLDDKTRNEFYTQAHHDLMQIHGGLLHQTEQEKDEQDYAPLLKAAGFKKAKGKKK